MKIPFTDPHIIIIVITIEKPRIETASLLIIAQNIAIRTNRVKAKIDKMQQNSRCKLCSNRDKMINHIISECSKLVKKLKYDHTNKWYMPNPECIQENERYNILWDFDGWLVGWLFWFYGISTFVGYLMLNLFLNK